MFFFGFLKKKPKSNSKLIFLLLLSACSYTLEGIAATHRAAAKSSNKPTKNNEGKWKRCLVSVRWNNHHSLGRHKIDDNNRTYWRGRQLLGSGFQVSGPLSPVPFPVPIPTGCSAFREAAVIPGLTAQNSAPDDGQQLLQLEQNHQRDTLQRCH